MTGVTPDEQKNCPLQPLCAGYGLFDRSGAEPLTSLDKPEGRLDIIAWPGYIERGQTDKQYDWVSQFEKDTGCQVNVKTAATSDEMVSLMAKGGYDLVTASGDASLRLIMGKRVQPINTALIAGWGSLDPRIAKGRGLTSAVKSMARRISGGRTC
ncbi:ABC transporter, periplasmic spermidine putrescine-binding protein PotD [Klebsiella pneumoniae]|uniref:ABC transporter, periplasmic spermidine putrescine-binding protein PotD n=1 Tax=Klebsiella pneumoniae TaxID=573 RepID=A0A377TVX1_KLEPN|nr:ABC transporter, periplasmic spermidine putrescine-binding protein PotD [Klebsiella pneumoniae]